MIDILREGLMGSFDTVYSLAIVVIPLMIIMQIAKDYKVLDKISNSSRFLTKFFGMSKESTLPLLIGIIFGLSYGAGVLIQSAKEGDLSKKDMFLISVFLITCHAVFEDTLLFVAVGANGYLLLGTRIIAAIIITFILSKRLQISEDRLKERVSEN